jgi:hypothetical protein
MMTGTMPSAPTESHTGRGVAVIAALREAVWEHNADLRREGWVAIAMGVGTLAFMYLLIVLLCVALRFFLFDGVAGERGDRHGRLWGVRGRGVVVGRAGR